MELRHKNHCHNPNPILARIDLKLR